MAAFARNVDSVMLMMYDKVYTELNVPLPDFHRLWKSGLNPREVARAIWDSREDRP